MAEIIKIKLDASGLGKPVAVISSTDGSKVTQVVVEAETATALALAVGKRLVEAEQARP